MIFDRHKPLMQRTFALRALNAHETEINRHYWSFKVISEFSAFQAREARKADKARENEARKAIPRQENGRRLPKRSQLPYFTHQGMMPFAFRRPHLSGSKPTLGLRIGCG